MDRSCTPRRRQADSHPDPLIGFKLRTVDVFDDDEWVALLFAEVDGKHPSAQEDADTVGVLDTLSDMPAAMGPLGTLPRVRDELADDFDGWDRLIADGAESGLPPRAQALLDRMINISTGARDAVAGNHLVHLDCRTDNILMDSAGSAWIVDWPWASVGPRWLDGLTYLLDVVMQTGPAAVTHYLDHSIFDEMSADDADAVLASLAGAWYDSAQRPAPPDMPTIRAFQKAEADAAVAWLSHRWA